MAFLAFLSLLLLSVCHCQITINDYYRSVNTSKNGREFQEELARLISNNINVLSYDEIWDAFYTTDVGNDCGDLIYDIYSSNCWTPGKDQCGSSSNGCYNREHSWPKSWWDGSRNDAYTDLFHIFPTEGYVNSRRSNYPYGEKVTKVIFESSNGCQLGTCQQSDVGYSGTCFEPVEKGILARAYFYMNTRYNTTFTCCDKPAVDKSFIKQWQFDLLMRWHQENPPKAFEKKRNDAIFKLQHNRNPFIDYPDWVDKVYQSKYPFLQKNMRNKV